MKLEKLTQELEKACGTNLKSVVLYGSAAAGDHTGKRSDYNVLVVTDHLRSEALKAFSKTAKAWARAGNPPPLLFTMERLNKSTDVFPVELLDIKECHKILTGEDVVSNLEISTDNLRLQIEHELRGNLIQLRQQYLLSAGNAKEVCSLMVRSLSSFLVLFRASLRLFSNDIPQKKFQALEKLNEVVPVPLEVFQTVEKLKNGSLKPKAVDAEALFEKYTKTIECVTDAVDAHIQKENAV
ncbi:MAG: nucleotidyltransferase domain-containing protein [Kiritimatiellales bacterium]|nr:nucleotidyltransferase domain-containing protein [Kiritimatiellota bacterium]MBL7011655.1 nucleotidyltransferase domain-containing protein [Kiritimatiellales bacterium]